MLFGFFNTLAIFKGNVNIILAKKFDIFIIIYLNNILIYIKELDENYIDMIQWIFKNL